jgi:hypothetical protein
VANRLDQPREGVESVAERNVCDIQSSLKCNIPYFENNFWMKSLQKQLFKFGVCNWKHPLPAEIDYELDLTKVEGPKVRSLKSEKFFVWRVMNIMGRSLWYYLLDPKGIDMISEIGKGFWNQWLHHKFDTTILDAPLEHHPVSLSILHTSSTSKCKMKWGYWGI